MNKVDRIIQLMYSLKKPESLDRISTAIRNKREIFAHEVKMVLDVGSKVKIPFQYCKGRKGRQLYNKEGIIKELRSKKAVVDFGECGHSWNVPYSLLVKVY